jgi:hypothetical protein
VQGYPTRTSPSGHTAKTLILVGLILQGLFVLILLGFGILLLIVFVGVFLLIAGFLGLLWLILVYTLSYRPASDGNYESARTPTLIFAILSFLSLSLISAILYLIAYIKLGDAVRETTMPMTFPPAYAPPIPGAYPPQYAAPYQQPPPPAGQMQVCLKCGTVRQGTDAFCSRCGTAWPA